MGPVDRTRTSGNLASSAHERRPLDIESVEKVLLAELAVLLQVFPRHNDHPSRNQLRARTAAV
jgi:hypothetical protein